ncbi:unnamed protein product [Prunus armeniaca]
MPVESAPTFDAWTTENLRVKGWLIDSMSPELMGRFIRLRTAKEIWDAVKKVFYDGSDESQVYELNRKAFTFKQNGQPVSKYYSMLQSLFQELDHRDPPSMVCAADTDAYQKKLNRLRVHNFLFGLDPEFDQVRSEILRKEPKLDLDQSFAYVCRDAQQRANFIGAAAYLDATVMVAQRSKGPPSSYGSSSTQGVKDKPVFKCTHCGGSKHTRTPSLWYSRDPPVSGNKSNEHTSASASMATSGASDHMTSDSNKIISLSPYSQSVVSNANSSSSLVVREGSLSLTDSLHLDLDILTRKIIGYGTRRGKLYFLDLAPSGETRISQAFKTSGDPTEKNQNFIWLWHRRLGHASFGYLKKLFPSWFSKLSYFNFKCDVCELAKSHRVSFPLSMNKSTVLFAIVHSDVWVLAPISTPSGAHWFVTFIDDCTEVVRASLFDAQMPRSFWGEAVFSAAYLINRVPSSVLNFQTPLQAFPQQVGASSTQVRVYWLCLTEKRAHASPNTVDDQFDLEGFVTLESLCHPTVQDALTNSSDTTPETMHESLDDWSRLVSSPTTQSPGQGEKNDVSSEPTTQVTSQNIDVEDLYLTDLFSDDPSNEIHLQPYQLPVRKNCGIPKIQYEADPKAKVKYLISNHVSTHRLSAPYAMLIEQLDSLSTPSSVEEALMDPNWKQAMSDEMQALQKNSTWKLVPLPSGKRTVGCRWIYTIKLKADGSIERYTARLVAKGYTQRYGVDYQETFALVAKINTVRILISLAANLDWPLHQFDVKNAFLHGDLEEEVYMDPPPGCNLSSKSKHYVCKLKKSLYGLKQSPRAWFGRLTKSMRAFGYKQSNFDHTLFLKHKENKITALIVYVDDMIVTGDDPDERKALQEYLSKEFEMKDLGTLKYFLGIEVSRSQQGIFLSQ